MSLLTRIWPVKVHRGKQIYDSKNKTFVAPKLFGKKGSDAYWKDYDWDKAIRTNAEEFNFAIFWHITTGQWRQYIPTSKLLSEMLEYYLIGIFRNAPHPTKKSELSKLNPLQRLTYHFGETILRFEN